MKVLIAVESTEQRSSLAEFASRHSWPAPVKFLLVHVVAPVSAPISQPISTSLLDQIRAERKAWGEHVVSELKGEISKERSDVEIETVIADGDPKVEILRIAEDRKADMIVVGSHGRSAMNRFFLGSVSLAVLTHACSPVVVVRPTREPVDHCGDLVA